MQSLEPYHQPDYNDLPGQFPPDCASAWGEDQYGIWFDLSVNEVVQRFRWVPKGQFTMGSPESEAERELYDFYGKESLHEVTLTKGYWLADTICTQALWQSITGSNPASFTSEQNPVETVSWLDVQEFLEKLNQLVPNLSAQLPSEAQWEYACRAGTISPFSFGDNITPEQVNYNGNYPYAEGKKGEYRERTIPVKALAPNQWGLHQMHGNVWEWCFDEFQQDLGREPMTNPVTARLKAGVKPHQAGQATEPASSLENIGVFSSEMLANADDASVLRVLRGGSWNLIGRYCRSAVRHKYGADARNGDFGFRLSLGL